MVKKREKTIVFEDDLIPSDDLPSDDEENQLSPVEEKSPNLDEVEIKEEKPKKVDKRRRKRTPEEVEKLKQNLAKGREKSKATRAKLNKMKKIAREEAMLKNDEELLEKLTRKKKINSEKSVLLDEIEDLKQQLNKLKTTVVKPVVKPVVKQVVKKVEKPKLIQVTETPILIKKQEPAPFNYFQFPVYN